MKKIPDFILLRKSREEVGRLESEIDYLQHQLKERDDVESELKKEIHSIEQLLHSDTEENIKIRNKVKKRRVYRALKANNKALMKRCKRQKETISELITKLNTR